jgi:heme-degrading monooxygenase HmoA
MSTIRVEDGYLTLFNIFHTPGAAEQDELFAQWRSLPPADVQKGLVAGNFHRSLDGRSVVNYAQWETKDDYDAFLAEAGTRRRLGRALSFSRMDNVSTEVVQVADPPPELSLDQPWFTVVVVVTAAPEHQPAVLEEMTQDPPGLADMPGYVSHAVHRGLSGEHVVKYAQWKDEDSYRAFAEIPQPPSPLAGVASAELHFCRLEYIRERS